MKPYAELWYPYTLPVSNITFPNRLVLAPMTTYSSYEDGTVTDAEVEYLRRRAAGGFGTIITAACYVDRAGKGFVGQWGCDDDRLLPSLRRVAEAIKAEGAIALLQIHDAGRMSDPHVLDGPSRAPSAVAAERPNALVPRAMSDAEIELSIVSYAAAARRAVEAGYDGVEIHGANTYLLQQFFSPHSNRRDDPWGGDLERRMRFPLEVVQAVRLSVGDDIIVGYRFSPEEVEQPGITMEDTLELVHLLSQIRLDYLHVSLSNIQQGSLRDPLDTTPRIQVLVQNLGNDIPLIGSGSVIHPDTAIEAIRMGIPLVAIGRAALYEPEWPQKVRQGQLDQLQTCLPTQGGAESCTLPPPLYERILNRPGWVPLCADEQPTLAR